MVINGTTASLMTTFRELIPFSNYRFEVAAVTTAGVGPLSEPVYVTTNQTGKTGIKTCSVIFNPSFANVE